MISSGDAPETVSGYSGTVNAGNPLPVSGTCASPDDEHRDTCQQRAAILKTFGGIRPASTGVQVNLMLRTGLLVEIETYAMSLTPVNRAPAREGKCPGRIILRTNCYLIFLTSN
ncbi:hypothetical protein HA49_00800 [Tatumella morbirosei]|uniref:Uncharacterized protein n=1 Tax=Tatumella morbirosei TaxID=642227 RepID=A0A095TUC3_9GAMM|nr:hypothetical protein HA49_00800 [Tatumella morbirosei]